MVTRFEDINFSSLAKLRSQHVRSGYAFLAIISALAAIFMVASGKLVLVISGLAFLIVGAIYLTNRYIKNSNHNELLIQQFIQTNGFTVAPRITSDDEIKAMPGSIFTHGHSRLVEERIAGSLLDLPFELFTYYYTVGRGKYSQTYDLAVFSITLPRRLPQMVIDSLVEPGNDGSASVLPIKFDSSQKIDLEGNFYKYFSLYVPDSYAVSALSIIAPNIMEVLLEHAARCDIEISGDKLYFYWPNPPQDQQSYENIFKTVDAVLYKVRDKLTHRDIFATKEQAVIHSSLSKTSATLEKSNLRNYIIAGIVGLVIVAVLYIKMSGGDPMEQAPGTSSDFVVDSFFLIFAAVFVVPIFYVIYLAVNYQRKKRKLEELEKNHRV